ncbi:hypothetical protein F4810DRAFT_657703 [Camillea tinctor]|nr:hypothetical protein F4810DRAFT_657703 [Camillea tinctor]
MDEKVNLKTLPAEIISNIVTHLWTYDYPYCATLSPRWKEEVERVTFRHINVKGDWHRLGGMANFARIVTPARRAYVRTIRQEIEGPANKAVQDLFKLLSGYDNDDDNQNNGRRGSLHLDLYFCMLAYWINMMKSELDLSMLSRHQIRQLPAVRCVTGLTCRIQNYANGMSCVAAIELAMRMPHIKRFHLLAEIGYHIPPNHREELARFLDATGYISQARYCKEVVLWLEPDDDQEYYLSQRPSYLNSLGFDPLGASLRTWSHNLVSLDVRGVFDGSLFWPSKFELDAKMPDSPWPRLKNLFVKLVVRTPARDSYLTSETLGGGYTVPCERTLDPLFESWATALGHMRVLEQATILFQPEMPPSSWNLTTLRCAIGFQAPSISPHFPRHFDVENLTENEMRRPRLIFRNMKGWRPKKSTMEKLHAVGRDRFPGTHMVELEINEGLPRRSCSYSCFDRGLDIDGLFQKLRCGNPDLPDSEVQLDDKPWY